MRGSKRAFLTAVLVVAVALLLGSNAGPAMAQAKTLKIGMVNHLGLNFGRDTQRYFEAYVPYLNKKGGLTIGGEKYNLQLIIYDSKFSAELGRSAVERLVNQDNVKFVLGDLTADAWLPLTEAKGVIALAATPSPAIYKPELKYAFQTTALGTQPVTTVGYFVQHYPQKNIGMICTDDLKGRMDGKQLEVLAKTFGLTVKDTIFYPPDQSDFSSVATRMKVANPEVVTLAGFGMPQYALAFKALRQAGWKGMLLNYRGIDTDQYKGVVPLDQLNGALFPLEGIFTANPRPVAKELRDVYVAKWGKWDSPTTYNVGAMYILLEALKQAQSLDADKVAAVISKGLRVDTPMGEILMVPRPDMGNNKCIEALYETFLHTVENGQVKPVATVSIEQGLDYIKKSGIFKAK